MEAPRVAYQGVTGSFSYLAVCAFFGATPVTFGKSKFRDIFSSLQSAESNYAVVPVENSLVGSIYEIYDLLWEHDFFVAGEYFLRVRHNLLAMHNDLSKIRKVYSHPKALEQCRDFLESQSQIEVCSYSDTARAAQFVAESNDPSLSAIASEEAAKIYNLTTVRSGIEDDHLNYTRFLVLNSSGQSAADASKCSLIFTLPHTPQSLLKALQALADEKINITKIQSRPIQGKPFEYVFYIDLDFQPQDLSWVRERIEMFKAETNALKVLGFYKKGSL